ncbi:MAG: cyanophycinase [Anaerolineales bacterium]
MRVLMPMGGALDELKKPEVLLEFVKRCGGKRARIVVFPQASARRDTGKEYVEMFKAMGAKSVVSFEFRKRAEAGSKEQVDAIRNATGIFFSGGTQMRIFVAMSGSVLEKELMRAYQRGCVIGGTSAGASILSKTMIVNGKSGPTPHEQIVQFAPGLGFTDQFVFDQHFRQRDRLGRLIYAVCTAPGVFGVGIDEDTAAIVENESRVTVCGSGAVTIVDGQGITDTDVAEVENGGTVAVSNLTVHVLTRGCVFNTKLRKVTLPQKKLLVD